MKVYNYSSFNSHSRQKKRRKFNNKRTHLGLFNNPFNFNISSINSFYFQIAGIFLITLAIIISFQTLIDISSPITSAGDERDSIRVMTNFQTNVKRSSKPKVKEIIASDSINQEDAPESEKKIHVVKANENLYTISDDTEIPLETLVELNNLELPYTLEIGQELVLAEAKN